MDLQKTGEPNGKSAVPVERPVSEDAKAVDPIADAGLLAGAAARPLPFGKVSTPMAERQRDRDPAPSSGGGLTFTVNVGQVIQLAVLLVTIAGAVWTLKSDLRDVRTTMDFQNKIQEERYQAQLKHNDAEVRARTLLSLTVNDIEKALIRAGIDVEGAEVRIHGRPQGGNGR